MSEHKHTAGKLEKLAAYMFIAGPSGANVCAVGEPRADKHVGYTELDLCSPCFDEAHENGDRIMECWNAMDGIADPAQFVADARAAASALNLIAHRGIDRADSFSSREAMDFANKVLAHPAKEPPHAAG